MNEKKTEKTEMKHGQIGKIRVRSAILTNACINTECVWHTCHWSRLYENGCYKLNDISHCVSSECSGFDTIEEAKNKGLI